MIEFSEDLSKRITGTPAMIQRVKYRLSVREGEIPYFNGGLAVREFTYDNSLTMAVRSVLSDFNYEVNVADGRVSVGDIIVELPRSNF